MFVHAMRSLQSRKGKYPSAARFVWKKGWSRVTRLRHKKEEELVLLFWIFFI